MSILFVLSIIVIHALNMGDIRLIGPGILSCSCSCFIVHARSRDVEIVVVCMCAGCVDAVLCQRTACSTGPSSGQQCQGFVWVKDAACSEILRRWLGLSWSPSGVSILCKAHGLIDRVLPALLGSLLLPLPRGSQNPHVRYMGANVPVEVT